ncbi:MAG: nuclear transport factor 2 family protein [Novosphingobium sp.]
MDADLKEWVDRQKIYEVIARYCRGVDRGDPDLIRSVYHADATDDHGMFQGLGHDFADWIVKWNRENIKLSQHFIGNFLCEFHKEVALTETYCISFSEDFSGQHMTVYNRYLDRFEFRHGHWKIAERRVVLDLTRIDPISGSFGNAPGWDFTWGRMDDRDPVYPHLHSTT